MKVEKKGEVEIIKLERKRGPVKKRGLIKRGIWTRMKARVKSCLRCKKTRPITITADQLGDRIIQTFGSEYRYHILLGDSVYIALNKEYAENLLKGNKVDTLPYIAEYGDCDDFADALVGTLTEDHWAFGFAFGVLWYYTTRYGHAINWFFDGVKIWLIEPQNDRIYSWEDILKYEDPQAKAFMVKV